MKRERRMKFMGVARVCLKVLAGERDGKGGAYTSGEGSLAASGGLLADRKVHRRH